MIKKKKKLNFRKVISCIIILFIFMIITININKKNKEKELTILINNEFVETIHKVIIDEGENIYFSKEDIQKIFDETIYYNEAEKELITTYNTHVALLKINEEYAVIDDENIKLNGNLQEIDKRIYLPIKDLQKVYDIELEYTKENNRIIIDSLLKEKREGYISKKTKLHEKKGFFDGKTLENLIIGEKIFILEDNGKYRKIRTSIGNIGYIKSKKISDEKIVRENVKYEKQEISLYENYSNIFGIYDNISIDSNKLNVVSPTFFYIDTDSKVLDKTTSTTATYSVYKNWTDSNGLQIMPGVTNTESVSSTLLTFSQRSQAINSLKDLVIKHNYLGINIKFDSIDDINSFYRFLLELYPRFKRENLKVAITLNDSNLEKNRLENVVDYIFDD